MTLTIPTLLNPRSKAFLFAQLLFWGCYGVILKLMWVGYDAPPISWFVVYISLGFITSYILGYIYWQINTTQFIKQCLLALFYASILAMVWRITFNLFDFHVYDRESLSDPPYFKYLYRGSSAALIMYGWSAFYLLLGYYHKYQEQRLKTIETELLLRTAEIKRLRHQINPHLLFNALHSLDTLLLKNDVINARTMVSKLSVFLRDSLTDSTADAISLNEEIAQTKRYLEIESIRFGDRLNIKWQCELSSRPLWVPCFLLQPLVENAIKHGVEQQIEGSDIIIECIETDRELTLSITNKANMPLKEDVAPTSETTQQHTGMGLKTTKERLRLMYAENATFDINQRESMFNVTIRLSISELTKGFQVNK